MLQELIERFRRVAAAHDMQVKGRKMPYTAINGNMFAFVTPEGEMCLRFDDTVRAELARQWGVGEVMQYGAVMRGYVAMPADLSDDEAALAEHFVDSLAFARTLKPKPTKKP